MFEKSGAFGLRFSFGYHPSMRTLPLPTDETIAALVGEVTTTLSIFGHRHGDTKTADQAVAARTDMAPNMATFLVDAYLSNSAYMPGAEPDTIPTEWRSLREHTLSTQDGGSAHYTLTEYLPDAARIDPSADPSSFVGLVATTYKDIVTGLTKRLGKPALKQKQKVEFEWGITDPSQRGLASSGWGGIRVHIGTQKEINLGGGTTVPWGIASLTIELLGKARP